MEIYGPVKLRGTLVDGTGDELITKDASTDEVGTASNALGSLTSAHIFVGNGSAVPTDVAVTGDISIDNTGLTAIGSGVIVNADVNATAAIAYSKLASLTASRALVSNASGVVSVSSVTDTALSYVANLSSDAQTQISAKQATITGAATTVVSSNLGTNKAVISNGSGKLDVSTVTTTELGYISGLSSSAQTQLNSKLTATITGVAQGDIIYYNGSNWVNLARGTNGQALYSTATSIQWDTPTINGIPIGGSANQVLAKQSGTDFDADWETLTVSSITDLTATAAELNVLDGITATVTELNYTDGVSSPIQTQLDGKQSSSLPQNAIWVGNSSNVATALSGGTNGYVLTSVSGVPTWQAASAGSVPGSDTQVLFNDGGSFGADAGFIFLKASDSLGLGGTPGSKMDVWSGAKIGLTLGADNGASTRTNSTVKWGGVVVPHYTNAEEPFQLIYGDANVSSNTVFIGGNNSLANCATNVQFFLAADTTTVTGSSEMVLNSTGLHVGRNISTGRKLTVVDETGTTNAVTYVAKLSSRSSGTPATGIGVGMEFEVETAAGNNEITSSIESVTTSVTSTAEYADLVLKTMGEGTIGEVLRISKLAGPTTRIVTQSKTLDIDSTGWKFAGVLIGSAALKIGLQESATIDRRLHIEEYDSNTNTVLYPIRVSRVVQGGNGAAGIGVGMEFELENGSGTNVVGATIEAITTDATNASEDIDLVFKTMSAGATAAERFRVTSDGRLYGTALHNNAGSVTGTTNQYIASGTYTPTCTSVANLDSTPTVSKAQWIRVGNVVHVSAIISVNATSATTLTEFTMALPIASNLGNGDCNGTGSFLVGGGTDVDAVYIWEDATANEAKFSYFPNSASAGAIVCTFQYVVL